MILLGNPNGRMWYTEPRGGKVGKQGPPPPHCGTSRLLPAGGMFVRFGAEAEANR